MADRQKILFFLSIPLAIILIYTLWMQVKPPSPNLNTPLPGAPGQPEPTAPSPLAPAEPSAREGATVSSEPSQSSPEDGETKLPERDPFQLPRNLVDLLREAKPVAAGPNQERIELPPMTVQGIFWGISPAKAIINNQILTEGDTLEGAKVVKIGREGVTLEYEGTEAILKVPQPTSPRNNKEISP